MLVEEIQTTFEIDKSSWTKVKLGDVVREVRETLKDPVDEGIERIVGLEHLEPESLHIRTWGTLTDGTTFTKVFRKGQVLFGRRRAYLKKAALATFDGICSGDITVLEAKEGLLPELLPFLIQNDKFFELAVKNSAGSLSPRAKFADFADYEFLLPPVDEQEQIAELLWIGDDVIEKALQVCVSSRELFNSYIEEALEISEKKNDSTFSTLGDIADFVNGRGFKASEWADSGIPIIRIQNLNGSEEFNYFQGILDEHHKVNKGDLLFAWSGNIGTSFGPSWWTSSDGALNQHIFNVKVKTSEISKDLSYYYLFKVTKLVENKAHGSAGLVHITKNELNKIAIKIPASTLQEDLLKRLDLLKVNINNANIYLAQSRHIQNRLISQIF